jgi:hypothetical protein
MFTEIVSSRLWRRVRLFLLVPFVPIVLVCVSLVFSQASGDQADHEAKLAAWRADLERKERAIASRVKTAPPACDPSQTCKKFVSGPAG